MPMNFVLPRRILISILHKKEMNQSGFTLVELVAVIIIIAILAGVAVQKLGKVIDNRKLEKTKQELNRLAFAVAGNPDLYNHETRSDFGYIGDVGALPPNLDALMSNPGGYSTWNGPYFLNEIEQHDQDYKWDAWGTEYVYNGAVIRSIGGGDDIVRRIAASVDDLLYNKVTGNIYDLDGTTPGSVYRDSVMVQLFYPDGAGGITGKSFNPDIGGFFVFDSIPIGSHKLEIIYPPGGDTIDAFVKIIPAANVYSVFYLADNYWQD
jgi:prepilin-type N-terminal cleavage/methylation domain-containing protein